MSDEPTPPSPPDAHAPPTPIEPAPSPPAPVAPSIIETSIIETSTIATSTIGPPLTPSIQPPQDPEPPLYDPYAFAPTPRPTLSRLALSSVLSLLIPCPVGSILAILFGLFARREIEREGPHRRGYALATAGVALGLVATMVYGGVLSYFVWTAEHRVDPAGDGPAAEAPRPPPNAPTARPAPATPPADLGPFAPKHTKVKKQGEITVVDVGSSTSSLADELAKQRAEAASAGETLLVMTTANRCDPCRGVDRSLADAAIQAALAKTRLVRVDILVFHDDLVELKMPDEAIPGFFLLAPDLTPRDGVDGGEWDDDIPPNIAPVLGPFVRGKYATRRRPWRPVPASGTAL